MGDVTNSINNSAAASFPSDEEESNEDLLIDFQGVFFKRDGRNLVGPVDWQVELDERWVIIGPNGAGKTTLIRMASAEEFLRRNGTPHGRTHRQN